MRMTTLQFDLLAWRQRLNLTQASAAKEVGMSLGGYCAAEYRATDHQLCDARLAKLCAYIERFGLDVALSE